MVERLKYGARLGQEASANPQSHALVAVIVLIFNDLPHCLSAIDSVINQSFRDIEIVIMDNGSTDGSWSAIQQYASDPRVRLVRNKKNQRSEFAALEALRLKSKYFSILFADDRYNTDRIGLGVAHLERSGDDYVFFNNRLVDENGNELAIAPVTIFGGDISEMDKFGHIKHFLFRGNSLHPCAMLVKTSVYQSLQGFRPYLHRIGDLIFFFKLMLHARGQFLPQQLQEITVWAGGRNESARNLTRHGGTPDAVVYERTTLFDEMLSPEFLSHLHEIFGGNDDSTALETRAEQLWYLGHALLPSFDTDVRLFAFKCMYMAASEDYDLLSEKVHSVTGTSLAEYIFNVTSKLPIGAASIEAIEVAKTGTAKAEINNRRLSIAILRTLQKNLGYLSLSGRPFVYFFGGRR